ncbi:MAG: 16S rRNA (guanine(527)-N(7))-methyltransferase RsmG, partial [Emergencia sp.]
MGAFTKETFVQKLEAQGIVLSTKQLQQFETYAKLLAQWNEKINLTAIVEENEVYEKHFYDSILPFLHMDMQCLCDVGAGAGFPSIPVKILYPQLEVTILEPLAKRIRFLEELCAQLSLTGVH